MEKIRITFVGHSDDLVHVTRTRIVSGMAQGKPKTEEYNVWSSGAIAAKFSIGSFGSVYALCDGQWGFALIPFEDGRGWDELNVAVMRGHSYSSTLQIEAPRGTVVTRAGDAR